MEAASLLSTATALSSSRSWLWGLPLSCELSPTLLSDSERSSLYTLSLSVDGRAVTDGSVLDSGASIAVTVSKMSEAQEPAALDLSLERPDGSAVAAIRLRTSAVPSASAASTAEAASEPRVVPRIDGDLPPLNLSSQTVPGAYKIDAQVAAADGKTLQRSTFVVFVGTGSPALESVLAYPPTAEPGASFLLAAVVGMANAAEGTDPWICWSRDGKPFIQGPLSAGFDRVVWTAPRAEGAYPLAVDVYPAPPPGQSGFDFRASQHQDFKAMVRMPASGSTDEFADALGFYSLLRFSGNFDDSGTRLRSAGALPFGSPQLDVYSGGFGYRFGPSSGVELPDLLPPAEAGSLLPLVLLFRVAPDSRDGRLIRFTSDDGGFVLDLGLHDGHPYVELQDEGRTQRSTADAALGDGPTTLAALLTPEGGRTGLLWIADGERLPAPPLPLPSIPTKGKAVMGGSGSLAGVYGDFGLISRAPPPALFLFAQRRRWRGDLVLAEGFENRQLPQGAVGSGQYSFSEQGVSLSGGAAITLGTGIRADRPLFVDMEYAGPQAAAALDLDGSDGALLCSLRGSGELGDRDGARIGQIAQPSGHICFVLAPSSGGLTLAGEGGASVCRLGVQGDASVQLVLRNGGATPLCIRSVLVRSASASSGR